MTLLFIDDDPDDTGLYCEAVAYLNSSEFIYSEKVTINCLTAINGEKALALLSTLHELPEYIFLDVNMPVMGGKECLEHLKANSRYAHIPTTILSTALSPADIDRFKALGAANCIIKPSGFGNLVKILSRYVYSATITHH